MSDSYVYEQPEYRDTVALLAVTANEAIGSGSPYAVLVTLAFLENQCNVCFGGEYGAAYFTCERVRESVRLAAFKYDNHIHLADWLFSIYCHHAQALSEVLVCVRSSAQHLQTIPPRLLHEWNVQAILRVLRPLAQAKSPICGISMDTTELGQQLRLDALARRLPVQPSTASRPFLPPSSPASSVGPPGPAAPANGNTYGLKPPEVVFAGFVCFGLESPDNGDPQAACAAPGSVAEEAMPAPSPPEQTVFTMPVAPSLPLPCTKPGAPHAEPDEPCLHESALLQELYEPLLASAEPMPPAALALPLAVATAPEAESVALRAPAFHEPVGPLLAPPPAPHMPFAGWYTTSTNGSAASAWAPPPVPLPGWKSTLPSIPPYGLNGPMPGPMPGAAMAKVCPAATLSGVRKGRTSRGCMKHMVPGCGAPGPP